jgi:hypothetical protein
MYKQITDQKYFVKIIIVFLLIATNGCTTITSTRDQLEIGQSQPDVIAILGQPDRVQEFDFPDGPFFGPQEALISLVDPGTLVLEWVYEQGDDDHYIWFSGGPGWPTSSFRVIAFEVVPADAVF